MRTTAKSSRSTQIRPAEQEFILDSRRNLQDVTDSYHREAFFIQVFVTVGKRTAQVFVQEGGSDPEGLLGGLPATKWGSPARFGLFPTVTFPSSLAYFPGLQALRAPGVKPVAIQHAERTFTFFTRAQAESA